MCGLARTLRFTHLLVQVRSWLDSVGDAYMSKKDLGDSLDSAYSLQEECLNVEAQLMVSILGRYSSSCLLPLLTTKFGYRVRHVIFLGWEYVLFSNE